MILGIPRRSAAVWALLVALTCLTWWLGTDHAAAPAGVHAMVSAAIGVAFLKMYLIGSEFMELRHAPRPLRMLFTVWVMLLMVTCGAIYLL